MTINIKPAGGVSSPASAPQLAQIKTDLGLGLVDNVAQVTLVARENHTGTQATSTITGLDSSLAARAPLASPTFTGTVNGISKTMVGLSLVDNTTDATKPVSTAQAAAIALKQATLVSATNIKTINGVSVLGSGDLAISGIGTGIDGGVPSSTYGGTTSINGGSP